MLDRDFPGKDKKVGIIGVPLGFGAGTYGSELGATAIRFAQLRGKRLIKHIEELGYDVKDYADVQITHPEYIAKKEDNPKYLPEMVAASRAMAEGVRQVLADARMPVILGGDHSIAIGTFSGIAAHFRGLEEPQEVGLVWFDAHADINTHESSLTGNIHGMPLAALLGRGEPSLVNLLDFAPKLNPHYCAHIGARDLDLGEKQNIRDLGLRQNFFTMTDIDKRGMLNCVEEAIAIAAQAPGGYAVTFDVDIIDPRFAPGSGTLVRGGITYREAHLALEIIAERGGMRSFEIVEVNPTLDSGNVTVELAGELILSALGKTIL